ncbi:beta-propeller domain-containing protein [Methanocaldococcus sp. 10A]
MQVKGIDETDIVKTDGKYIYYSPPRVFVSWRNSNLESNLLTV